MTRSNHGMASRGSPPRSAFLVLAAAAAAKKSGNAHGATAAGAFVSPWGRPMTTCRGGSSSSRARRHLWRMVSAGGERDNKARDCCNKKAPSPSSAIAPGSSALQRRHSSSISGGNAIGGATCSGGGGGGVKREQGAQAATAGGASPTALRSSLIMPVEKGEPLPRLPPQLPELRDEPSSSPAGRGVVDRGLFSSPPAPEMEGEETAEPAPSGIWSSPWFARFLVLLSAACYGTNFATVKILNGSMPLGASAAVRFSLAAVAVTAATIFQETKILSSPQIEVTMEAAEEEEEGVAALQVQRGAVTETSAGAGRDERMGALLAGGEIGAWYAGGYLCQAFSLLTTDASKVAFFASLPVVIVPFLDVIFKGRKLAPKNVLSTLLAVAGVALIQLGCGGPSPAEVVASSNVGGAGATGATAAALAALAGLSSFTSSSFSFSSGDALSLGMAAFFGIGYWRLERAAEIHPDRSGLLTSGQLIAVALAAAASCALGLDGTTATLGQVIGWISNGPVAAALLWTGLVSTALTLYLETVALRTVSASELTLLMTTLPLWGAWFANAMLGETLGLAGAAGGAFIVAGCFLSNLDLSNFLRRGGGKREQ